MGGKNHQPCREYLLNSTRLSRYLSLAFAHLEFGNAALEDILISELGTGHTPSTALVLYDEIGARFENSIKELTMARRVAADLHRQMDETGFADLPTLGKIDLAMIGTDLAHRGIVDLQSWQNVQKQMTTGGFYSMLQSFDTKIGELMDLTCSLQSKFDPLRPAIARGILTNIVEENRPESFKPEFAAVYTAWTKFNALFLASSLMSTELWYAFTGKGSLATTGVQLRAA